MYGGMCMCGCVCCCFVFASRGRQSRCALVTGVQACALPSASRKELERVVRSQRQDYLDTWLIGASDRLSSDAVALLEASLADPDSSTGFNRMKGDAGQATLDNILDVTEKLAFIQRLDLPHDLLTATGKPWVDQIV